MNIEKYENKLRRRPRNMLCHDDSIKRAQRKTIQDLPNEMLEHICNYLTFKEMSRLSATTKKLRKSATTSRIKEFVDLSNEAPSDDVLGEILLGRTKYLNWVNGRYPARLQKGIPEICRKLWNNKSNLTGLCVAGFKQSGRGIAEIIAKLPNLTVLDISYSQFSLIETIARTLPKESSI